MGASDDQRLTRKEIGRLVNGWIGVDGGYLGEFSYAKHDLFWLDACDLEISTAKFEGTTRACFEHTLLHASARDQAAALRAIFETYPPLDEPDPERPKFRSPELHREIRAWISRLETGQVSVEADVGASSEVVRRALDDAATLLRTSGAQSAVDRVHTALHGYMLALCAASGIVPAADRPTMNQLFKALRTGHPAFVDLGARGEDIVKMLGSMATILDALNPVRNQASVAHPNDVLVGEAEAVLVINLVSTLLSYFDAKQRALNSVL